ncbi:MAG: alanine racemase, partial [Pseudomonadota bacterium]
MTEHEPGPEPGFDAPAARGMTEDEILTPALVVDLDALDRNIARMQTFADQAGLRLRPHAKTHRCADVARLQMAAGAVGLSCQTLSEAEALARAGLDDLLITNQVRGAAKTRRLARLARRARIGACVDDAGGVAELSAAALAEDVRLDVLVEVDVGGGRCGASPGFAAAALALAVHDAPGLRLAGLQAYDGGAQHVYGWQARRDRIAAAAARLSETLIAMEGKGLVPDVVGGAGTGSHRLEAAACLWTELQCGSYIFMDVDYAGVLDEADRPLSDH